MLHSVHQMVATFMNLLSDTKQAANNTFFSTENSDLTQLGAEIMNQNNKVAVLKFITRTHRHTELRGTVGSGK